MPAIKAPLKLTQVRVPEGVRIYTGIGHAPFKPGRAIHLPEHHATALLASGHAELPGAAAERAAAAITVHAEDQASAALHQVGGETQTVASQTPPAIGPATETPVTGPVEGAAPAK